MSFFGSHSKSEPMARIHSMERLTPNSSLGPCTVQDRHTFVFGKAIESVLILLRQQFSNRGAAYGLIGASK